MTTELFLVLAILVLGVGWARRRGGRDAVEEEPLDDSEPLDEAEIREAEDRFWEETAWEEPDEYGP